MTVISTIITKHCTAVASDSLITISQPNGTKKPIEWQKSKIVRVSAFCGSASYWGLAEYENWNTYDWLQDQCNGASKFTSLEAFAKALRDSLDKALAKLRFTEQLHGGIGIHLTGYEKVDDYWIPELFLCSNFKDPSYSQLCCLHLTRESYHTFYEVQPDDKHRESTYRLAVRKELFENDGMLIFNNGDPIMFNPTATAFLQLMKILRKRGLVKNPDDLDIHRSLVKRPIEIITEAQRDFCREDMKIVGGKTHDLVITSAGNYTSRSGD